MVFASRQSRWSPAPGGYGAFAGRLSRSRPCCYDEGHPMLTFLHAADIHLDSPLRGLDAYPGAPVEAIRGATRRAFTNLVDLALEESVSGVLIAGDLYDGDWKDFSTGLFLVSQLTRLGRAGIPVFIVHGNHDAANRMTRSISLPANVTVLTSATPQTVRLDALGVAVHGQSFATTAVTEDLSRQYPDPVAGYVNIGLLHTSVTGREGHEPYSPCTLEGLIARGYDYWALGHVHRREVLHRTPHIVFPGNLQGRHVREDGPKGCMLVRFDGKRPVEAEFRCLDVMRWAVRKLDATDIGTHDELMARFEQGLEEEAARSDGRHVALRLVIEGSSDLDEVQVEQDVRSRAMDVAGPGFWIESVRFITRIRESRGEAADGSIGEIRALVAELRESPELQAELLAEFADLARKLPPDLRTLPDAPRMTEPGWMLDSLDQVQSLLENRLHGRGGRPR